MHRVSQRRLLGKAFRATKLSFAVVRRSSIKTLARRCRRCGRRPAFTFSPFAIIPRARSRSSRCWTILRRPGLSVTVPFDLAERVNAPFVHAARPRVAILREQGVNGQVEMAAAFDRAGFTAVDVHMSDLLAGRARLADFQGLAACGGFSYGDVLGAGSGWAKTILFNDQLKEMFTQFFERPDSFSLGVCNGCQMMAQLRDIIPGTAAWPSFGRNVSARFEARLCMVGD